MVAKKSVLELQVYTFRFLIVSCQDLLSVPQGSRGGIFFLPDWALGFGNVGKSAMSITCKKENLPINAAVQNLQLLVDKPSRSLPQGMDATFSALTDRVGCCQYIASLP